MDNYALIQKKIVTYSEVVICLFDSCNLNCAFCPQDHNSTLFMNRKDIMNKTSTVIHWINNKSSSFIKIHLMGGELFQDDLVDKQFLQIYSDFVDEIKSKVNPEKELYFNFITNLVFTRQTEVYDFLKKHRLEFSISYDPVGRFTPAAMVQFQENLKFFHNKISMVSIVLSAQNIKKIQHGDPVFDKLYGSYPCDFDQFLPSVHNSDAFIPSASQIRDFYIFLIEEYPECLTIEHFITKEGAKKMRCTRGNSLTILNDGSVPQECSGSIFLKDGQKEQLDQPKIVYDYIGKQNCLTCAYYERCPFPCFVASSYHVKKDDIGRCLYKEVFDYTVS
ncbi:MAG: hypothetical protein CME65_02355 [Halobacteriovoraceae bacterium]|nr:hypothetical protein [Halobacteriovoraceae bacterium]|tara:strand:- start:15932 stop:16933 length:1002 start_codon:yes stop_codon:yes gene_type:complete